MNASEVGDTSGIDMSTPAARVPLDDLRESIARALSAPKAYELPAIAERLGLAPGTEQEAFSSKRLYVRSRIRDFDKARLLQLAHEVLKEFRNDPLADLVSEITTEHRVSEISRRDLLKAINSVERLFGETDLFAALSIIQPEQLRDLADKDAFEFPTLAGRIRQHYFKNDDWSHEELLIECGALACAQTRFFQLLEKLLEPVVRRGEEQAQLAATLNEILTIDGFRLVVTGEQSRHPVYRIERVSAGVSGEPKNLIFAAVNTKPDLYFVDAINNDIAIGNASDALIYDGFLGNSGLLWKTLVEWWRTRQGLATSEDAQRSFYLRLQESIKATESLGQYAMFDSYYREFSPRMGDALPALIPEVYLHYDPRTVFERGDNPVLRRQRMDFLLLLDHNIRIVIEVDGRQHYSEGDRAVPAKYAQMVEQDRRLRLGGYELYRFGAAEFSDAASAGRKITVGPHSRAVVVEFFNRLWCKHEIKA